MAKHESVSRFYETVIGRSRAYIHAIYPTFHKIFEEELGDISEEDCLAEGIQDIVGKTYPGTHFYCITKADTCYVTPREPYAKLIDKISGKGTWDRNPLVFVYEFELIK